MVHDELKESRIEVHLSTISTEKADMASIPYRRGLSSVPTSYGHGNYPLPFI